MAAAATCCLSSGCSSGSGGTSGHGGCKGAAGGGRKKYPDLGPSSLSLQLQRFLWETGAVFSAATRILVIEILQCQPNTSSRTALSIIWPQ